jgi:thiamine biosynthesis lipoprotein
MLTPDGEKPWMIGIQHPEKKNAIATALPITNGAVASSGTYERGAHIVDPATGLIAIGARATSVFGADGGIADALATALVVSGREGARWFLKPELAEYGCWGVDRNTDATWSLRWPEDRLV